MSSGTVTGTTAIHGPRRESASRIRGTGDAPAPLSSLQLLRPACSIAGIVVAGVAFYFGGMEALTFAAAAMIALWAFVEPRTSLCMCTAFMMFLFVFFQKEAPLGEELPEEFFYWGAGLALITAGLCGAALFSRDTDWPLFRKRMSAPASMAMAAMFGITLGAATNGLLLGNQPFAVVRQLFGCMLFPVYYFVALALFRSSKEINRWLRRVNWAVALGALWYAQKLSFTSLTRGVYFREQSPLTGYAGAIGVIAFSHIIEQRSIWRCLQGVTQAVLCAMAIVLMGNRAAFASLIVGSGLLVIVALRRQGLMAMTLAIALVVGGIGGGFYFSNRFLESRGLGGDIARRFIINVSDDQSFQGRMAQMEAVMSTVRQRPVLGAGMGSETKFLAAAEGRVRVTSVDNGWGYVMLKMGLLGLAVFIVLIVLLLRESFRHLLQFPAGTLRANTMALLGVLLYGIVVFWSGPAFFHFTSAGFFGTALAGIVVLSESRTELPDGGFAA